MPETHLSDYFCELAGLPPPERNYRFAKSIGRKWAFDLAWPALMLALEIEGGVWTGGRHVRGKGYTDDIEKYNAGTLLGWRILRCTPAMIDDGSLMTLLKQAVRQLTPPNNPLE